MQMLDRIKSLMLIFARIFEMWIVNKKIFIWQQTLGSKFRSQTLFSALVFVIIQVRWISLQYLIWLIKWEKNKAGLNFNTTLFFLSIPAVDWNLWRFYGKYLCAFSIAIQTGTRAATAQFRLFFGSLVLSLQNFLFVPPK